MSLWRATALALVGVFTLSWKAHPAGLTPAGPLFEDYPAAVIGQPGPHGLSAQIDWTQDRQRRYEAIRRTVRSGPNFAGRYALVTSSCGMICLNAWIADANTGQVYELPFVGLTDGRAGYRHPEPGFDYKVNSALLVAKGCLEVPAPNRTFEDGPCGTFYYRWQAPKLILLMWAPPSTQAQTDTGTLRVRAVSLYGNPLPAGVLSIRTHEGQSLRSEKIAGEASARLPYGKYVVEYQAPLFSTVRREVLIDRPESFIVMAAQFEGMRGESTDQTAVSVALHPAGNCSIGTGLWVRLMGVYSGTTEERPVDRGGFALFAPVPHSTYVVIIVDGRKVRATKAVETSGPVTAAHIALNDCEQGRVNLP